MTTDIFPACFDAVVGNEGRYTSDPEDPGNWTGGASGKGLLRGTKWGVSAAAFPTLDIAALTLAQARDIYRMRYWTPLCADQMPAQLAVLAFDAAINNGLSGAGKLLQRAVGAWADGAVGPATLAALAAMVTRSGVDGACAEFQARRIVLMAGLPGWKNFALGWSRRLARLPYQAVRLAA